MHPQRPTSRPPLIQRIALPVYLFLYVLLGLYNEYRLNLLAPIPEKLLRDFGHYQRALVDALNGIDPYQIRTIGPAYLYPPPALLVVELFRSIEPFALKAFIYSASTVLLLTLIVIGTARCYGYSPRQVWYWFVLCLASGPFLEVLHRGQINLFTMFGIFLLFFAETKRPLLAGVGLCLAIVTKVTPLVFLGYLAVNLRIRVIVITILAIVGVSVVATLRYGFSPFVTYLDVFQDLLREFPLGSNSQSLVAKVAIADIPQYQSALATLPGALQVIIGPLFSFFTANYQGIHRVLVIYIMLVLVSSGLLTFFGKQPREPLFMSAMLGMTFSPNILWYHHYVFILLPLLIWMGWSRLNTSVVIWCLTGLLVIQIDRFFPPYGLLIHFFAHLSLLYMLWWQIRHFARQRRRGAGEAVAMVGPQ
jgi:hypothetical protein